jgi:hypothetical protein
VADAVAALTLPLLMLMTCRDDRQVLVPFTVSGPVAADGSAVGG